MLDMNMQLDISVMLIPHVTTIICHHTKKILLKKEKREIIIKLWGTRTKLIC